MPELQKRKWEKTHFVALNLTHAEGVKRLNVGDRRRFFRENCYLWNTSPGLKLENSAVEHLESHMSFVTRGVYCGLVSDHITKSKAAPSQTRHMWLGYWVLVMWLVHIRYTVNVKHTSSFVILFVLSTKRMQNVLLVSLYRLNVYDNIWDILG